MSLLDFPPVRQKRQSSLPKRIIRRFTTHRNSTPAQVVPDTLQPQLDTISNRRQNNSTDTGLHRSLTNRFSEVRARLVLRAISLRSLSCSVRISRSSTLSESRGPSPYFANMYSLAEHVEVPQTSSPISSGTPANHQALDQQQAFQQIVRKASAADVPVPALLQQGIRMSKVSPRSQQSYIFRLDVDRGRIVWESKRSRIVPIEDIKRNFDLAQKPDTIDTSSNSVWSTNANG
ncbi:hypothetical protein EDC04DRAFT_1066834 [Pisolithus marmoratus]|nr:hypothetical protein EDC04DRAFT_1066834 [Pisolithus marmoratus]